MKIEIYATKIEIFRKNRNFGQIELLVRNEFWV